MFDQRRESRRLSLFLWSIKREYFFTSNLLSYEEGKGRKTNIYPPHREWWWYCTGLLPIKFLSLNIQQIFERIKVLGDWLLYRQYFTFIIAQCRKNTRPPLFLFAGRVSRVFCMKINQENLNYHKKKFHSKSSQGDLKIQNSNVWVYFFHFQNSLILSYLKLTHAKNSGNSVNFS